MKIDVSFGELVDKITILIIKTQNVFDKDKLEKVHHELSLLNQYFKDAAKSFSDDAIVYTESLFNNLIKVNKQLWNVEDSLRIFEKNKSFNDDFIQAARSVYHLNDQRFNLKNKLNMLVNSDVQEVKSYEEY